MALTTIKTGGLADNSVTDAKVADAITITGAQTGITQVGTLTAGTWNGTVIASAYLDADTAHLSGTQTFSGAKTFSSKILVETGNVGSAHADWDTLTLEENGRCGLTIISPNDNYGAIDFADGDGNEQGMIQYKHSTNQMFIKTVGTSAITLDSSQNATFSGNVELNSDSTRFKVGASDDCHFYHNGTDSYLQGTTGHLYLHNNASSKYIHILQEGASGGIKLHTNNTLALTVDSSQNATFAGDVIAGTSSAFANSSHYFVGGTDGTKGAMRVTSSTYGQPVLDVHGTSTQANDAFGFRVRAGNGSAWISDFQESNGTSRLKVLGNGNVGLSCTPSAPLHILKNAGLNTTVELLRLDMNEGSHVGGKGGSIVFKDISVYEDCLSIEGVRDGVSSHSRMYVRLRESSTAQFEVSSQGYVKAFGDSVHTSSDETLKKNISTIPSALDKVNQMRGVQFKWKKEHDVYDENHQYHQRVNIGFIAQELEAVVPEIVNTHQDTGIKSVQDANQINALLVEALKELSAKVTALENA